MALKGSSAVIMKTMTLSISDTSYYKQYKIDLKFRIKKRVRPCHIKA